MIKCGVYTLFSNVEAFTKQSRSSLRSNALSQNYYLDFIIILLN